MTKSKNDKQLKTGDEFGKVVVTILILCSIWNAFIVAVTLHCYLYTIGNTNEIVLDYVFEIQCIASICSLSFPIGVCLVIVGIVLVVLRKIPVTTFYIACTFFVFSMLPVYPIMRHFIRIHSGDNVFEHRVWWYPGK